MRGWLLAALLLAAGVDWALGVGERDLVRGRAPSLDLAIPWPPALRSGAIVRVRGAVHAGGVAFAPFDAIARVR